jgi:hypothetical protein
MPDNIIPHNVIDASDRFALFRAIPGIQFDWANDEWAATHAPALRIASLILARNDRELQRMLRAVDETGEMEALLELLMQTHAHIAALDKMLTAALARSAAVLERMGH